MAEGSLLNKAKSAAYWALSKPVVRKSYEKGTTSVLRIAGSSRPMSHMFHTLFPVAFSREQHAVTAGRVAYYSRSTTQIRSSVRLRRNTHRLEKGLLMRPPRPVFATDYIAETVEAFQEAVQAWERSCGEQDSDELRWASDVLSAYFQRVQNGVVDTHRNAFAEVQKRIRLDAGTADPARVPYRRNDEPPSVSHEDLLKLAMRRRSVRWFEQREVPRSLIDQALLVARQAPTACNRMPYEFRFYDEPELVQTVASIPFGAAGYSHNIPVICVVLGRLDSYFSPRDRHGIYIDASLAAMGFMYGLETVGLSSSVINWPDFEPLERRMAKTLGLEIHERPVMLIAVGFPDPDGLVAYSQKKELDSFRTFNHIASGDVPAS
jgi:nitroreductase